METLIFLETERNNFVNSLINDNQPFILKQTNYSEEIIFDGTRYLINQKGYNDFNVLKFRSKILSDIKLFETGNKQPRQINKHEITYFDLGRYLIKGGDLFLRDLICIDIKAAYPSTFKLKNYITKLTFDELIKSTKEARLKACGSIATEKLIFTFDKGDSKSICVNSELKRAEKENYFFDVVKDVSYIMAKLSRMLGKDFLFYWVDGVFFKGNHNINLITDVLNLHGYEFKIEYVEYMKIIKGYRHYSVELKKEGKKKIFNLPVIKKKRINFTL